MRFLRLIVFVMAIGCMALANGCRKDADCPGYVENAFCNRIKCDLETSTCAQFPNPCPAACIESEHRCVDCIANEDCSTGLCDLGNNKCKTCYSDADCPKADWCHGGHQVCIAGKCKEGRSPCENPETCVSSLRQCFTCKTDSDCGEYNFCTHPVVCDHATGACVQHAPFCRGDQICDAQNQRCVECTKDSDCHDDANLFCAANPVCNVKDGVCKTNPATEDHCNKPVGPGEAVIVAHCVEARKECVNQACVDDSDCDDGDCTNGVEQCERHLCVRTYDPDCKGSGDSAGDNKDNSLLGASCETAEDCHSQGYLCEIVSHQPPVVRECRPCSTDADCSDGNPENGDEACDLETGKCQWPDVLKGTAIAVPKSLEPSTLLKQLQDTFEFNLDDQFNKASSTHGFFDQSPFVGGLLVLLIVLGSLIFIGLIAFCIINYIDTDRRKSKKASKQK